MKTFIPMSDNILVEAKDRPDQTASGLYIPTVAQEGQVLEGKVLAVGSGRVIDSGVNLPLLVSVGSTVWFPKFNTTRLEFDGKDFYIVSERNILGIAS